MEQKGTCATLKPQSTDRHVFFLFRPTIHSFVYPTQPPLHNDNSLSKLQNKLSPMATSVKNQITVCKIMHLYQDQTFHEELLQCTSV